MPIRYESITKLRGKIVAFAADENGAVLPFVTAFMAVLFGFAILSTDMSRYLDLQTQLQKAADAFALAGAAELDGSRTAEARADAAIAGLLTGTTANSSIFGAGAVTVAAAYYSQLPATDNLGMASGTVAATPADARFVSVVVAPVTINSLFPAALAGAATNAMTTSASAVAGFTQAICRQTPIYICDGTPGGANDMMNPSVMRGKEVSLVANPGAGFAPGNYGFLDIGCGNNTPCLNQALGGNNNQICVNLQTITTTTGQKTASKAYFNTRFDLYQNDAKNADQTLFSPDVNVRKGYTAPENCNKPQSDGGWSPPNPGPQSTNELPLPDDSNITDYSTVKIGNGNWTGNYGTYRTTNFPTGGLPAAPPTNSTGQATRYALYQYEIANKLMPTPSVGKEVGAPVCAPPADARPDRRALYAAVVDCSQLTGGQNTVTPKGVVKFFLLQPVNTGTGFGNMLAEYVDLATPNDASGIIHDIVQLYR